jgi:hypothetical protein
VRRATTDIIVNSFAIVSNGRNPRVSYGIDPICAGSTLCSSHGCLT